MTKIKEDKAARRARITARKELTVERKRLVAVVAPHLYCADPLVKPDDYYKGCSDDAEAVDYQKRVNRLLTYFNTNTLKKLAAAFECNNIKH